MSLISIVKSGTVMSVDPSTNSLAFSIMDYKSLKAWGKIHLPKGPWQDKFKTINTVLPLIIDFHKPTHFVIEQSIYISNPLTSRSLAYINGCSLGVALSCGVSNVSDVPPLTWKPFIGYKNVRAAEKKAWAEEFGEKESKKIASFERKERTKRIIDVMIPNHGCDDHDIVDSMGIGIWSLTNVL